MSEEEKVLCLSVVSRPLRRHRYSMGELAVAASDPIEDLQAGENQSNQAANYDDTPYSKFLSPEESPFSDFNADFAPPAPEEEEDNEAVEEILEPATEETEEAEESEKPGRKRFRRLKKPNFSLFEEVVDEEAELEKELNELINQDNYYGVVLPYDVENEFYVTKRKKDGRLIAALIGVIAVLFGLTIYLIGDLFA